MPGAPSCLDQGEHLIALLLHQRLGARLEVQAEERFRVRGADVHVPVLGLDREPVEVRDAALSAEALLQLLQLDRDVRDTRVDLAGEEVARAELREDLAQLPAARRHELEHEQERDHSGVRLREVAEVVVRRHLAAEDGTHLAHSRLDERMPDAVHERLAAGGEDRLRHGPRGAHVVDHLAARLPRQDRLGKERRREVAGHELAAVVDEEAAVGVTVVGDPEVGALLRCRPHDELAVLRQERVRLVVRERPVGLEVAANRVDLGQPLEHPRQHRAGHPVRGVDHDAHGGDLVGLDEREHAVDEPVPDVLGRDRASRRLAPGARDGAVADVEEPRLAPHGQRPAADDLHPGVVARIVRGGHHHAAVEAELADREVDHLGSDHPEVDHVRAGVRRAVDQGRRHRRRREPHVPSHRDPARLELLDIGAADRVGALLVEVGGVDPAHVVRLEDLRLEHGPMLWNRRAPARGDLSLYTPRIARIAWDDSSVGDSEITVAGRSKHASASASGSARSVPSPYGRCFVSFRFAKAMSEKWTWKGAPGSSTPSAFASASANASTEVSAPSEVACMCAKSTTGRTQPSRREISTTSSSEPSSRTRPITSIPNGTARSFASSRARSSPSWSQTESIASWLVRPRRNPGWKTTTSAPAALAIPAEWASIPTAMFSFFPRSAWPMNPAIGACTESAIACSRASAPKAAAKS